MGRGKNRRTWLIVAALVAVIAAHDVMVDVPHAFGARAALFAIGEYRIWISPRLRGHIVCRFSPTCSYYGRESIRKYGLAKGGLKTVWRIARCGPWTPQGTVDLP